MATKTSTVIKGVASLAGGSLMEGLFSVIRNELGGDAKRFFKDWGRAPGESRISANNLLKMAEVLLGMGVYRHVDPFPNSKVDNFAAYGIGISLLYLLLRPHVAEQAARGGPISPMEAKLIEALAKRYRESPEEIRNGFVWLVGLTPYQKAVLESLTEQFEDSDNAATILSDPNFRIIFPALAGEPPVPQQGTSIMDSVRNFNCQADEILVGDDNNPGPLRRLRRLLENR